MSRLQALVLVHCNGKYEKQVAQRKKALFAELGGAVLEIGPGVGANLEYYPPGARWRGIEPNRHAHPYLAREAARLGLSAEVRGGVAERLEADDESLDAVVSTLVLCSVEDLGESLREIRRVLKPGGKFVFIEHVAASPGSWRLRLQWLVGRTRSKLGVGCRLDRETGPAIRDAGFTTLNYDRFMLPIGLAAPHIAGVAIKPKETS